MSSLSVTLLSVGKRNRPVIVLRRAPHASATAAFTRREVGAVRAAGVDLAVAVEVARLVGLAVAVEVLRADVTVEGPQDAECLHPIEDPLADVVARMEDV